MMGASAAAACCCQQTPADRSGPAPPRCVQAVAGALPTASEWVVMRGRRRGRVWAHAAPCKGGGGSGPASTHVSMPPLPCCPALLRSAVMTTCESIQLNNCCGNCTTDCRTTETGMTCQSMQCQCPAATPYFFNGRCRQCTTNAHCALPNTVCDTTSDYTCKCAAGRADCNGVNTDGCEVNLSNDPQVPPAPATKGRHVPRRQAVPRLVLTPAPPSLSPLPSSRQNCGSCGNRCAEGAEGWACVGGICGGACLPGWTWCGGTCQKDNSVNRGDVCCATITCQSGFGMQCSGAPGSPGVCRCNAGELLGRSWHGAPACSALPLWPA